MAPEGRYTGTLVMRGTVGLFLVQTPVSIIEQDMRAEPSNGDVLLIGSNPRQLALFAPSFYSYSPDTFRLIQLSNGAWTIADTCDAHGGCVPVHIIEASLL